MHNITLTHDELVALHDLFTERAKALDDDASRARQHGRDVMAQIIGCERERLAALMLRFF